MHVLHKNYELSGLKTAGLADGEFIGWASTYGNIDAQGDRVVKGAFAASVKSITDGDVLPVLWEHVKNDPRMQVGQIKSAEETDEGLRVHVALDLDTETGRAAYKAVKSRRVKSLSIGYGVLQATKAADGAQELKSLDLVEVSLVARPANDRATITASKAADKAGTPALVKARKASAELVADDETTDEDTTEMTVGERLVASLEAALAAAQDLIDAAEAEGRDLTDSEAESVEKAHGRARRNKADLEAWEAKSPSERHGLQFLADVIDGRKCSASEFTARWGTSESPADALTKSVSTPLIQTTKHTTKEFHMDTKDKFLQFGSGRKAAAQTIVAKMLGTDNANAFQGGSLPGTKALTTSGQVITDVPVASEVMATGRPAVSILDVIPTNQRSGPMYRYIRQTSRALDAAAVAPGAEKPVSAMGTTTVDAQVSVIAHLSEPIDKFVLSDAPQLARFVQEEMLYGLAVAIQAQVLSGDGTGANQTGLLNTSGVQVQAFATNILTSIRKAITAQESLGYAPSVLVISPADWEALELLATTDAALSYRGVPLDQGERRIWGLRAVLSTSLPAKTALVLDPNAVSIDTVGGVEVEWAKEAGDLFSHNQIQARVETRIGVSVYQPAAVVKVATAA
ncbi:HK97 family phage prohead protease [Gordonia sp. NPDC003950]